MKDQSRLFVDTKRSTKVDTFERERGEGYRSILEGILGDSSSRLAGGFPETSSIRNILDLSEPPQYTACPNPFVAEMVDGQGKRTQGAFRDQYAADVSDGKNDPVYQVHSYHTKVPHKAIMRYILHYTDPGDVVFDGFCGTGMTGVAAVLCGDTASVESLHYRVTQEGAVYDGNVPIGRLGKRRAILSDLSPVATFIARNYTDLHSLDDFADEAMSVIDKVESTLSWLYEDRGRRVAAALWSDVFVCPVCTSEFSFYDAIGNNEAGPSFMCPHCRALVGKVANRRSGVTKIERKFETVFDPQRRVYIREPALALVGQWLEAGKKRVFVEALPGQARVIAERIRSESLPKYPLDAFAPGRQTNKLINGSGIQYVSQMYTPRALLAYASLWEAELSSRRHTRLFRFCLSSINNYISRKQGYSGGGGGVAGTLYTPSNHLERNVFDVLRRKVQNVGKLRTAISGDVFVSTQSISDLHNIPSESVDYIFTDPPFGDSIQYAELNSFIESWLKVKTAPREDCVLNYVHNKGIDFYSEIMRRGLAECARILKPGHWMTIVFHNSQNSVWMAIQNALELAGLMIADVRTLNKRQRSFNAVTRRGTVNQDLVISAYKPRKEFTESFASHHKEVSGVIEFVREYLSAMPVGVTTESGRLKVVDERTRYLLYDRMIAYYLKNGIPVPMSAPDFYHMLDERFVERDDMYFLHEQAARYDALRIHSEVEQGSLFVHDEKSAIQWIRSQLSQYPLTLGELTPRYLQEVRNWDPSEQHFELRTLLRENFILDEDERWRLPDPNRERDLDALRRKNLLRVFSGYVAQRGRIKVFRREALLEGFRYCWESKQFGTVLRVCEKLPLTVVQGDREIQMYSDIAKDMVSTSATQLEFKWEI
ncbi:MAG: DNA methyltransferase [Bacillota bacterium]